MDISSEWLILSIIIVFVVLLSFFLFHSLYYYKIPKGIPFIKSNTRKHQLALRLADVYRNHRHPIVGIRLLRIKPCLIISDLALVKSVLAEKFSYFQNRGLFYNEIDDPLSAILGTVDHKQWKPMRQKLTPAFKCAKMKNIFPILKSACDELVKNLIEITENGEQMIEILDIFSRCTTDAIGTIVFGYNANESAGLREMIVKAKQPYLKYPFNLIPVAFPELARFLRFRKHPKEVSDFFVNFVIQIVQYRQKNNIRLNDFMQSWIDAELEFSRIAAIAFDLLSAGYADSTSTLAYCLYELAINRNIQDSARDEIQSVLDNQEFTYDSLQQMTYCHQIIKETERKYPVAGFAVRVATKDFIVPNSNNITIPCGMKLFIPIYGIHHDEHYYRDPEVFNPDRFTEEAINERPRYAFLPFGAGPRQCIGYRFAEMLIGIGLVSLLQNFEFSTSSETRPIEFNQNKTTLHPKSVTLNVRRVFQ